MQIVAKRGKRWNGCHAREKVEWVPRAEKVQLVPTRKSVTIGFAPGWLKRKKLFCRCGWLKRFVRILWTNWALVKSQTRANSHFDGLLATILLLVIYSAIVLIVTFFFFGLFCRLDPIISHVPVQELKLSAVRFAVDSEVIFPFKEVFSWLISMLLENTSIIFIQWLINT